MHAHRLVVSAIAPSISLVNGDPALRRTRQLMLRAENYEVRGYSTCAAMLADAMALQSACVIVDVHMRKAIGLQLLREMRDAGWRGTAILLVDTVSEDLEIAAAAENYKVLVPSNVNGRLLLDAVRQAIHGDLQGPVPAGKAA